MAPRFILARSSARSVLRERSEKTRKTPRTPRTTRGSPGYSGDATLPIAPRQVWLHATTPAEAFATGTIGGGKMARAKGPGLAGDRAGNPSASRARMRGPRYPSASRGEDERPPISTCRQAARRLMPSGALRALPGLAVPHSNIPPRPGPRGDKLPSPVTNVSLRLVDLDTRGSVHLLSDDDYL